MVPRHLSRSGLKARDLAGLRGCAAELGNRWRFGILLHSGSEVVALDPRTLAVPLAIFPGRRG
ncbi:MAG: hypothetical protein ACE5G2_03610 [Candidatus Krumholzibacteriia bacterium]